MLSTNKKLVLENELNSSAFIGLWNYDMDIIFNSDYETALREINKLIAQAKPTAQQAADLRQILQEAWNPTHDDTLSPREWLKKREWLKNA